MTALLQRTPFNMLHRQLGGKMVDFAGWDMPVQFQGVIPEHKAVRERAGIFDISHMGQLWCAGAGARASLQKLVTNDLSALEPGKGIYAMLCKEDGGVVDDLYIYCLEPERFLVIVNASRKADDLAWMTPRLGPDTDLWEQPQAAALALQGPNAAAIMRELAPGPINLAKNGVGEFAVRDMEMVIARTGYTGEDGFEFFAPAGHMLPAYESILKVGLNHGLALCGLGARDTLRLEMGYRLYGNDLDESHTALEAGLGWAVKLDKGEFIGREALKKEKDAGSKRKLIALALKDRGVPRHGSDIVTGGRVVGQLSSGTFSPSLQIGIGMGYVAAADESGPFAVRLHGRDVPAEKTKLPFFKR